MGNHDAAGVSSERRRSSCSSWKSTVLLEDLLRCWKMNGRSKVLLENQLYWRQSTGLDGNYRSRKITARRWLHKYVGAECGASSFTWYLYQMCNTDVRLSVCLSVTPFLLCSHHHIIMKFSGVITTDQGNVHAKGHGQRSQRSQPNLAVSGL